MNKIKKTAIVLVAIVGALIFASVIEGMIPESLPSKPKAAVQIKEPALTTPADVETAINKFRTDRGLHTLNANSTLELAAQERAETMCAQNDWTHDKAWQVLDQYYEYATASENLHYDRLQDGQAANAVYGWEHSPGHLKTMLAEHAELGVGVKYCPGYQGMANAVLITSYYGLPR